MTSDPRTGTEAREDERWPVIAAALDAHLDYQHADCDDSCGNRWEEAQYRDALADAVLAALAAVPAPTDEGDLAEEIVWAIHENSCDHADRDCGLVDEDIATTRAVLNRRAAAVPAPTDEGRAAQCVAEHWSRPPSRCALDEGHVGSHVTASGRYWWHGSDDEPAPAELPPVPREAVKASALALDEFWGGRYGEDADEELSDEMAVAVRAAFPHLAAEVLTWAADEMFGLGLGYAPVGLLRKMADEVTPAAAVPASAPTGETREGR